MLRRRRLRLLKPTYDQLFRELTNSELNSAWIRSIKNILRGDHFDVNTIKGTYMSALFLAVCRGDLRIIYYILLHGGDPFYMYKPTICSNKVKARIRRFDTVREQNISVGRQPSHTTTSCDVCLVTIKKHEPVTCCSAHGNDCNYQICDPCSSFTAVEGSGIDFLGFSKRKQNLGATNAAVVLTKSESGELLFGLKKVSAFNLSVIKDAGLGRIKLIGAARDSKYIDVSGLKGFLQDLA